MEHRPKNIRQIGGNEERVKIYMEDYVSTYLRRIQESQEENGATGFLVGTWQQETDIPCVFIGGAVGISRANWEGGQVCFSQEAWNEGYQSLGTYFSGQELCGLFVCEGSCRRFRKQALFAAVRECFPDRQAVLYLLTEEGEELVYRILPRTEERLQGYYCYFERNQSMQDYMVDHLPDRRTEWELPQNGWRQEAKRGSGQEGSLGDPGDPVYRSRQKIERKKETATKKGEPSGRGIVALCAVMALVIVVSGMGLAYREKSGVQMQDLLSRLQIAPGLLAAVSAMPEETGEHYVGRENDLDQAVSGEDLSPGIQVEEIPGNVYPTEAEDTEVSSTELTVTEPITTEPITTEPITKEPPEALPPETAQSETLPPETTPPETLPSIQTEESKEEESFPVGTGVLYTVKSGDSLYSISRRFYGTEEMVIVIQQLNDLENADLIKVGQELLLP